MSATLSRHNPTIERPPARMRRSGGIVYLAVAGFLAIAMLAPIVLALIRSFQITGPGGRLEFDLANYAALTDSGSGIVTYTGNSMFVAVGTALLATLVATCAGFGLARLPFRGSGAVFVILLTPFMVPFQGILTSLFLVLDLMKLDDSLIGLTLVYTTFQLPFSIFIMRNSFAQVPKALEEAALIDGASTFQVLTRILWPFAVPGAVTVALYAFLFGWNDFIAALTLLVSDDKFTLPIALRNLQTGAYGEVDFGLLDAGAVVAMVPCIILFLILQRHYVGGLAAGSVKM